MDKNKVEIEHDGPAGTEPNHAELDSTSTDYHHDSIQDDDNAWVCSFNSNDSETWTSGQFMELVNGVPEWRQGYPAGNSESDEVEDEKRWA